MRIFEKLFYIKYKKNQHWILYKYKIISIELVSTAKLNIARFHKILSNEICNNFFIFFQNIFTESPRKHKTYWFIYSMYAPS